MSKNINFKNEIEYLRNKTQNYSILLEECELINDFVLVLAKKDCTKEEVDSYDKESVYKAINTIKETIGNGDLKDIDNKNFLKLWVDSFMVY